MLSNNVLTFMRSAIPGNADAPPPATEPYPTVAQVMQVCPGSDINNVKKYLPFILKAMAEGGLLHRHQLIGVVATIYVETTSWGPIKEYGGSSKRYAPYFGRGFIQLTWKDNYAQAGQAFGVGNQLVENPDLALEPELSAKILVWYWNGATGNNPSAQASRADWRGVRKHVNGGYHGWDKYYGAVQRGLQVFTQDLDPAAIGAIPLDGSYGLGCVDAGSGGIQTLTQLNPQNQGAALAHALGITARAMSRGLQLSARLDPAADAKILELDAQKTLEVKGINAQDLDGTYTTDEVIFTLGDTLEVDLKAYQPDPNAPLPQVFRHDATQGLAPTQYATPGALIPAGDIPAKICAAAQAARGRSSRRGPGYGNVACAWAVNLFCVQPAGLRNIGNIKGQDGVTVRVAEMKRALENGRGQKVTRAQAVCGDIWIDPTGQGHVGICITPGCTRVLSNSSGSASFSWEGNINSVNSGYGSSAGEHLYRVLN